MSKFCANQFDYGIDISWKCDKGKKILDLKDGKRSAVNYFYALWKPKR